jgi:hypothetical protein
MRFLDPLFLWGLLAIAVPIALHLLLRRRLPVLEFPLTRLVLRAEHSRQPRKRLNRVLLMLTRAAILALLALALSRMTFGGAGVVAQGPVAAVVVVDDSLSMQAKGDDGGTMLESGTMMAASFVAALPEGSRVAVVAMSKGAGAGGLALGTPNEALVALEEIMPTHAHLNASEALGAGMRILSGSVSQDRRLVLVTDLARHGLSELALPRWSGLSPTGMQRPRLHVLAPRRAAGRNLAVAGLDATALPGGRLRLVARVAAWGIESPVEEEVEARTGSLGAGLRVAGRGRITAGLGASDERRFEIASPAGGFGESQVSIPPDVLEADDVRSAVHHVSQRPRLLVVDGDPQNLAIGSETFYLEKALAPGVGLDFEADIIPLSELTPAALERRSAVLLCNVPELSEERVRALESAMEGGTGLFVSLGNRVDPAIYNGRMARLLPATLGIVREARPAATVTRTADAAGDMSDLPHVSVRAWYTVDSTDDARTLLRLSDGSPLLVEGSKGAGRVLLLATTLDRDWTDLPISPSFLAFLRESIDRATPRGADVVLPPVHVGDGVPLAALRLGAGASIVAPDGVETLLPQGATAFAGTSRLGAWLVRDAGQPRAAFAVVTDPLESDLTRLSPDELALATRDATDPGAAIEGTASDAGGYPAWKPLLILLVCACAAEAWLARRAS